MHLHLHSEYSLLDGAARISQVVKKAQKLQMPALAITDHGSMFGVVDFYKACHQAGLKPILGCEVYVAPRAMKDRTPRVDNQNSHLVLLAETQQGYQNLIKLVSLGYTQGFYYQPRVDKATLARYAQGLIALSGCTAGEVAAHAIAGRTKQARLAAAAYRDIFGTKNFFLELQDHGLPEQKIANRELLVISRELDLPLVVTNDVHYINQSDAEIQDILMCIQTGKTVDQTDRLKFQTDQMYLKSAAEMVVLFAGQIPEYPAALANTLVIAERCNVQIDFNQRHLPQYNMPVADHTATSYLAYLCRQGAARLYAPKNSLEVETRLEHELKIINKMNFSDYFLIVWDFIKYAKEQQIPVGPGRGSAAGSIVAYCLGITSVDPLKYGLLFERFLNPKRLSMPDIDIDICQERRQEVINYVVKKYGAGHVAQIITFGTLAARAAIRDVGRVLNQPYAAVDKLAKMIPSELHITIEKALAQSPEFKKSYQTDRQVKKLLDIAIALEGVPRHASIHAAGLVISKEPLTDYLPLYRTSMGTFPALTKHQQQTRSFKTGEYRVCPLSSTGVVSTQFTMNTVEELGLLKIDLLGLRNLTVIAETLALLPKNAEIPGDTLSDINKIPLDNQNTYNMLAQGNSGGIFQLASSGMRALLKKSQPAVFEDLVALVALYRPGPLGSGMVEDFIKNKHSLSKIDYLHPDLEPVLKETYGVILYQEQVMKIAQIMAGYTLGQADSLRKAISKKVPEMMKKHRRWFIQGSVDQSQPITGALAQGYANQLAHKIFDLMEYFAGYGFNKSHSVAYALLAYQTAYLKANYPAYYLAALLTSVRDNADKVAIYINECRRMGIEVLPPDINKSTENFTVGSEKIRFGLTAIKNVGTGAVQQIIATREQQGYFKSYGDFCYHINPRAVNKRTLESLIKAGCFDNLIAYKTTPKEQTRASLLAVLEAGLVLSQQAQRERDSGQTALFGTSGSDEVGNETAVYEIALPPVKAYSAKQLLALEKEVLGLSISTYSAQKHQNIRPSRTLYLRLESQEQAKLAKIIAIIKNHPGKQKVIIYYNDSKKTAEIAWRVTAPGIAVAKLQAFLGKNNVVIKWQQEKYRDVEKKREISGNTNLTDNVVFRSLLDF